MSTYAESAGFGIDVAFRLPGALLGPSEVSVGAYAVLQVVYDGACHGNFILGRLLTLASLSCSALDEAMTGFLYHVFHFVYCWARCRKQE